jgi:hypothetical protein
VNDRIRELRLAGWSERRIGAELGVTRHRVRVALEKFVPPTAIGGGTWNDRVGLQIDRAKYREGDDEQLALAELAYDVAEWLDARWEHDREPEAQVYNVQATAVSLDCIVRGIAGGSNPLVRIHARRTFWLRDLPVPAWLEKRA